MGDVLTLIDKAEKELDQDKAREAAEKMAAAQFTLDDFLAQMREVQEAGLAAGPPGDAPGHPGGEGAAEGPPGRRTASWRGRRP